MKYSVGAGPSARSQIAFFFVVALGGTWLLQLPAVLAHRGILPGAVDFYMLPAALGGFSPLVAAVLAAHRETGRQGIHELIRSLRPSRISPLWYLSAVLAFGAIHLAGVAGYRMFGEVDRVQWLYLPETAQHVVGMVLVPLAEEPGWRGYALPRLQARFGPLRASLLLGVLWAAWHTMMFLFPGPSVFAFTIAILNIIAGSIVFSWFYNRTDGSLLIAILAHVGAHLNNPGHAPPGSVAPLVVYTISIYLVGCTLIVLDPTAWQKRRTQGP